LYRSGRAYPQGERLALRRDFATLLNPFEPHKISRPHGLAANGRKGLSRMEVPLSSVHGAEKTAEIEVKKTLRPVGRRVCVNGQSGRPDLNRVNTGALPL
jgi:hypothetical protein